MAPSAASPTYQPAAYKKSCRRLPKAATIHAQRPVFSHVALPINSIHDMVLPCRLGPHLHSLGKMRWPMASVADAEWGVEGGFKRV